MSGLLPRRSAMLLAVATAAVAGTTLVQAQTDYNTHVTTLQPASGATTLTVDLRVDQWRFEGTTARFWTRVYNGGHTYATHNYMQPGPLIRVKPGDTLTVNLHNDMGANEACQGTTLNTIHSPNTTNLHTHGLHISSVSPADSIFTEVTPGNSFTHVYNIPADHAGGTHWYHAHHHGSTGIQAGGGLAGVLIVEDLECDVPTWVSSLPERVLMINEIAPTDVNTMAQTACGNLWTQDFTTDDDFLLVNGLSMPDVTIEQNTPTRLRMVYAAILATLQLTVDTTTDLGCTWKVLSKDGVYLADAPRDATTLYLAPGNRVDVVVTCTTAGTTKVISGTGQAQRGPRGQAAAMLNRDVFNLVVTSSSNTATELVAFQARRPAYMADLQSATVQATHTVNFAGGPGVDGCTVNGQSYVHSASHTVTAGQVNEWTIGGTGGHPFHLHVNPYQLQGVTDATNWYKDGDWHDVMYTGFNNAMTVTNVRFATQDFTGDMVLHCHFLEHEDLGCMTYVDISGTEGATTGLSGTSLVTTASVPSTCSNTTSSTTPSDDNSGNTPSSDNSANDGHGSMLSPARTVLAAMLALAIFGLLGPLA